MRIEKLRTEIDKIKSLLDDPQEGLMSWNMALSDRMTALIKEWRGPRKGMTLGSVEAPLSERRSWNDEE